MGMMVGVMGISAAPALDIRKTNGVYDIVDGDQVVGTFWNPKTGGSDVKFTAGKGVKPELFWSADGRYLAANGGTATNGQVFLYETGGGTDWTPVASGGLSDEQLAPLQKIGDWTASGTEALRWQADGTLLMRIWAEGSTKGNGEPPSASVWATFKMEGAKAEAVAVSAEEPAAEPDAATRRLDPAQLVGEHKYMGRNPNGAAYEGTVTIRAKGGLLLFQWTIGDTVTHGTGLLEDMTVGVALENGLAIYQAVPQAEGISLIGLWKTQGAKTASEETILVGNADSTNAKFEVRDVDGAYDFRREGPGEATVNGMVKISGREVVKAFEFQSDDGNFDGEGLALGDGLAVITPDGLAVYAIEPEANGQERFAGESVNAKGQVAKETLVPDK